MVLLTVRFKTNDDNCWYFIFAKVDTYINKYNRFSLLMFHIFCKQVQLI